MNDADWTKLEAWLRALSIEDLRQVIRKIHQEMLRRWDEAEPPGDAP